MLDVTAHTALSVPSVNSVVTDTEGTVPRLREAELHRLWLEQRFPADALTTIAGEPVRVLYRGRPGGGAGPDFRDARISLGGRPPLLGDIELHVAAADFRRHGHLDDPAYARVVLHVVFDAAGETATSLPGGGSAPLLALRPWVERRSEEIRAWLERTAPWREPCHTALSRLGDGRITALLLSGGEQRLRRKAAAIAAELELESPGQVLYRAICGALGLSRNVEPFRLLADCPPIPVLLDAVAVRADAEAEAAIRARLFAVAGFGPEAPALGALPWRLEGLRPNAHPRHRIEGLAALVVRHRGGLVEALDRASEEGPAPLLAALRAPGIGRERAVEIAVNAVIPFLIATGAEERAFSVARSLPPAAAYGRLTLLDSALAASGAVERERRVPLTRHSALAQQGALALDREWCRRGGCGVCPLS